MSNPNKADKKPRYYLHYNAFNVPPETRAEHMKRVGFDIKDDKAWSAAERKRNEQK